MIESFVRKVIFIDNGFLRRLKSTSQDDYDEFVSLELDTKIIELPCEKEERQQLVQDVYDCIDVSDIKSGSILARPSYSKAFCPVDSLSENIVLQKFGLFIQVCIALGAKKVKVVSVESVGVNTKTSASYKMEAGLEGGVAGGDFSLQSTDDSSISNLRESIMDMETSAEGGEVDIDLARSIIKENGLLKDSIFNDVVALRSNQKNKVTSHKVILDFASDMKGTFDSSLFSSLEIMSKVGYSGNANFEAARSSIDKSKNSTKLKIDVVF